MTDDNIHADHRNRMRERYIKKGATAFDTHQLLEMLLFNTIPRDDTNPTAHYLLDAAESDLLSDGIEKMCTVKGIGEKSALLLRNSMDLTLRLLTDKFGGTAIESEFSKCAYLYLSFADKNSGHAMAVYLNKRDRVIETDFLAKGRLCRSDDAVSEVVARAKALKADKVIVAHNHKNNASDPSVEDYLLTAMLTKELEAASVGFHGHYIVTDTDCIKIEL